MQVGTGHAAGGAHETEDLAWHHALAFAHIAPGQVRHHREDAEPVIDDDGVPGKEKLARRDDAVRVPNAALRFTPTAAMFAALDQSPQTPARGPHVWQLTDGVLVPMPVETGLSDGSQTELVSANLTEGTVVVTAVTIQGAATRSTSTAGPGSTSNPFMGMTGGPRR